MSSVPRGEAVGKARQILKETGSQIPVDVEAIAKTRGLNVVRQELEDSVSGILMIRDERGIILVNGAHHPNRQRFSIAHELGHYLLHPDDGSIFVDRSPVFFRNRASSSGIRWQEIEANAFAAELLMPEEELDAQLNGRPIDAFDEVSVRRLAARFGVSAQALTIRLTRLDLVTMGSGDGWDKLPDI
ncbi:MAG: ImmA/IrrE family metallo-endopeptidase [Actinomycetota bacterium]